MSRSNGVSRPLSRSNSAVDKNLSAPSSSERVSTVSAHRFKNGTGNGVSVERKRRIRGRTKSDDTERVWHPAHALILLLVALVAAVALEVLVVDYLFLGTGGIHDRVALSTVDMFVSDSGALVESVEVVGGGESNKKKSGESRKMQTRLLESQLRPPKEILEKAGVDVTAEIEAGLPPIEEVKGMYGDRPIVMGLETCQSFRDTIPHAEALIGVAGMFNTGTNLMSELLQRNCYLPEKIAKYGSQRRGIRLQVPWGKHSPVSWRNNHVSQQAGKSVADQTTVLPAVVIKDPYTWMTSMCRHPYSAMWFHARHCPNLVPVLPREEKEAKGGAIPVAIRYPDQVYSNHDSLAGLWNDWYTPWIDASFPRLIVRFEDLLYHPEAVVTEVCHCGGGVMEEKFQYVSDSAKGQGGPHTGSSGLSSSMARYSNSTLRSASLTKPDLQYARENLRSDIVDSFHYGISEDAVTKPLKSF